MYKLIQGYQQVSVFSTNDKSHRKFQARSGTMSVFCFSAITLLMYLSIATQDNQAVPLNIVEKVNVAMTTAKGPDVCSLPAVAGPCKGFFPRFFFDSTTQNCAEFIFGGCNDNGNNFVTKESCIATCMS